MDTVSIKYFPLSVGNIYVYNYYNVPIGPSGTYRKSVIRDTLMNGHIYFRFDNSYSWLRTDSITGSLYAYSPNGGCGNNPYDVLIDSLSMRVGEWYNCAGQTIDCRDTNIVPLFGNQWYSKFFHMAAGPYYGGRRYVKYLGRVHYYSGNSNSTYTENLKGCVINGIVYGDTSVPVGILGKNGETPGDFSLSQNFPNPFNAITNFKLRISELSFIEVKVFDITGMLITILLSQKSSPGEYQITFDGKNLPSGIYFYCLIVEGSRFETKKMILLK
jgi:type IX secretion system substrate protein